MSSLPPGLILILGAFLIPFLPGKWRRAFLLILPVVSWWLLLPLRNDLGANHGQLELLGYQLTLVRVDWLSLLFGQLFHLALLICTIYSLHVKDWVQHTSGFVYAGGTICAAFAGDLLTLFVFWELIAVASVFLIWARRTPRAYKAGMRYLIFQIGSGVLLLAGILVRAHAYGDQPGALSFAGVGLPSLEDGLLAAINQDPGDFLILIGIGIKAAFPGLHTWLTDAYPEATPTGTVYLASFTTKLAILALIRCFSGEEILIWIGTVMTLFPIFYAVIEDDLRRVLAYSMINQIGFMVIGVGVGTDLAIDGAAAHAFADVLFKGLLFMSMGAVLQRTGTIAASDLGGLYKSMPFTAGCCLVGAISISAFPLFSAFATKSMIVSAVGEEKLYLVWFAMVFASAGVLHHAGIKIPFCAFFAPDSGRRPSEAPWNMRVAMFVGAALCILLGCFPDMLYSQLSGGIAGSGEGYHPYSAPHVINQLQLLGFAILAFVVLMYTGFHPHEFPSTNLDADWIWRRALGRPFWKLMVGPLGSLAAWFQGVVLEDLPRWSAAYVQTDYGPERGGLRKLWVIGSSVFVVLILTVVFLLLGHFAGRG